MNDEIKTKFLEMGKKLGLPEDVIKSMEAWLAGETETTWDEKAEWETTETKVAEGEKEMKDGVKEVEITWADKPDEITITDIEIKVVTPEEIDAMDEMEVKELAKMLIKDWKGKKEKTPEEKGKNMADMISSRLG